MFSQRKHQARDGACCFRKRAPGPVWLEGPQQSSQPAPFFPGQGAFLSGYLQLREAASRLSL